MAKVALVDAVTKEPVDLPDSEAQAAITAGTHIAYADGEHRLIDSDGVIRKVPGSDLKEAFAAGLRYPTTDESKKYQAQKTYGGVAGQIATAVAGAASGATLGFTDYLASKTPLKPVFEGLYDANPGVKTGSEIVGVVGSALLSGGLTAEATAAKAALSTTAKVARAATAPARLMVAAGEGAGGLAAKAIANATTSKIVQAGVRTAVQGAVENTIYETGRILSESSIEDKEFTSEQVLSRLGTSAVLGGVANVAMHGLASGAGAAIKTSTASAKKIVATLAKQAEEKTGIKVGAALKEQIADGVAAVSSRVNPKAGTAEQISSAIKFSDEIAKHDEFLQQEAIKTAKVMDDVHLATNNILKEDMGSLRKGHIRQVLESSDNYSEQEAREALAGTLEDLHAEIVGMTSDEAKHLFGAQGTLVNFRKKIASTYDDLMSGRIDVADAYVSADTLKKDIGKFAFPGDKAQGLSEATETLSFFQRGYEKLRTHLEDLDLYGTMGEYQALKNEAWTQDLAIKNGLKQFMVPAGKEIGTGRTNWITDPVKTKEWLANLDDDAKSYLPNAFLNHTLDTKVKTAKIIKKIYGLEEKGGLIQHLDDSIAELEKVRTVTAKRVREINQAKRIADQTIASATLSAAAIGGVVGGIPGAVAGGVYDALRKPVQTMQKVTQLLDMTDKAGKSIKASAGAFFERAQKPTKAAIKAARLAGSIGFVQSQKPGEKTTKEGKFEAYQKQRTELASLATDTTKLQARIAKATEGFANDAPEVAAAVGRKVSTAVAFLNDKMPKPVTGVDPLRPNKTWRPSDMQLAKFERYAVAVENPMSVIDDLNNGRVSAEGVEALREVYPATYQRIVSEVQANIANLRQDLSFNDRRQLSILFGVPVEATMRPDFVRAMQSHHKPQEQQQAPSARRGRPMKLETMASDMETNTQRIAGGI